MNIFAVESSCDETSVAILRDGIVTDLLILSQSAHGPYGGVVPELAARDHVTKILDLSESLLNQAKLSPSQIDIVCATAGPGLIGSLLIGLKFAQSFAYSINKPFVPINHIHAHIFSSFIKNESNQNQAQPTFPFISLVISGGHTLLVMADENLDTIILGRTLDDAAGEAFDKTGKMLGLGYPSGHIIDKHAINGNPKFVLFPRPLIHSDCLNFSFSGLKTSVLSYIRSHDETFIQKNLSHISASIQDAIIEPLLTKSLKAVLSYKDIKCLCVSGGVSANSRLRDIFTQASHKKNINLFIPDKIYSTDNAAMIGNMAFMQIKKGMIPQKLYYSKPFPKLPVSTL